MARIAIIGLGYIGSSIGLGLRAAKLKNTEIVGHDDWRRARTTAEKSGAVEKAHGSLRDAVGGAGLVVLATPPAAAEELLPQLAPHLGRGAVVTDVASSKAQITEWASLHMPRETTFVGGHPMAGKAGESGAEAASATLFQGANWFLCPDGAASSEAVGSVVGMVRELGAEPHFLGVEEHDYIVGGAAHLPLLLASAQFSMLRDSEGWTDFGRAAADVFKTVTSPNSGDPTLTADLAVTNRKHVQHWIDRFILELNRLRDVLDGDEGEVFDEFAKTQINYVKFLSGQDLDRGTQAAQDVPTSGDALATLVIGQRLYERVRERTKETEERESEARLRKWR